jgi:cytochrome c oxidase subunit 2
MPAIGHTDGPEGADATGAPGRGRRSWFGGRRPWKLGVLAAAIVVVASSCVSNARDTTLKPKGPVARQLNNLFIPVFWIAVAVFVLVAGLVLVAVFRFRARSDDEAPKQVHGNTKFEIGWTIIPALLLAGIAIPTVKMVFEINRIPAGAMTIDVTGHRWWWQYDYTNTADTTQKLFSTANEMHIPAGQKIVLDLSSVDVIHNFWPPALAGKVYAIPGRTNHMVIEADKPGTYYGQCAEYCGTSHANMRLQIVAQTPADFQAWEQGQQQGPVQPAATGNAATGLALFKSSGCAGCHAITGISNGQVGPNLTHFKSRAVFAGSIFENTDPNLRAWLRNPPAEKPGSVMPNLGLTEAQITNLISYLDTLK